MMTLKRSVTWLPCPRLRGHAGTQEDDQPEVRHLHANIWSCPNGSIAADTRFKMNELFPATRLNRSAAPARSACLHRLRSRRGASIVLVMGLISVCLALSFSLLRTQSTVQFVQRNSNRGDLARQAAMSGMAMALQRMQTSQWAGVGTNYVRSLGATEGFTATYVAGDSRLSAGHADYSDLPLRVTIEVEGYSQDASDPNSISTHQVRGVARLIPRYLTPAPSSLATMLQYTVCGYTSGDFSLDLPCRIEGPIELKGRSS